MSLKRLFHLDTAASETWPQRPVILAGLGAAAGLAIHLLTQAGTTGPAVGLRGALVLFLGIAALLAAFTFERNRPAASAAFAIGAALLVGLVSLLLGGPLAWWDELWRLLCILIAIAVAAPLFQAARDAGRPAFDYRAVHDHAWTDVLLAAAAVSFTGIVFGVLLLLGALFQLIGIGSPFELVTSAWFASTLAGATLLGAVGWLRERVGVMRGTVGILALIAPVMGAGLAVFLLSIPFTGLAPLWEATRATTPILLGCIAAGLVVANSVVGAEDDDTRPGAMRWGALAIALALLPLALIAAVSVSTRIAQHGLMPERIWALVFVGIATAYGLGYLVAVLRGRGDWRARIRDANLRLAVGLGALALFLALPIVDFNAIATRDQLARLEEGRVPADAFDFAALRFRLGAPGRAAIERLAVSPDPAVAERALGVRRAENPWDVESEDARRALARVRVLPRQIALPAPLLAAIRDNGAGTTGMAVLHRAGSDEAILLVASCRTCPVYPTRFRADAAGAWQMVPGETPAPSGVDLARARIELRPVQRRQVFVDGRPVGQPFE